MNTLAVIGGLMVGFGVGSLYRLYKTDPNISVVDMFHNYWWVWVLSLSLSLSCIGGGWLFIIWG